MSTCPCGSAKSLASCCGPLLAGTAAASTAEALMRSRYTAYAQANVDYITETHDPETRDDHDADEAKKWAESSEWLGLEIVSTEAGSADDTEGAVEFVARYRNDAGEQEHHEQSAFVKRDGQWYFTTGRVLGPRTVRNEGPKVGRNDPCPCGSGKKFKKCCGRG